MEDTTDSTTITSTLPKDATLVQIVQWIQNEFAKHNYEVDLTTFVDILNASKQFKSLNDAKNYFELLDVDKSGTIKFTEFLAPILPELSVQEVETIIAKDKITLDDLTMLQIIFKKMYNDQNVVPGHVQHVKLTKFLLEVKTHRKDTLNRAYKLLVDYLPSKVKNTDRLEASHFSNALAKVENELLKKYCLFNYFDTEGNENITDFTIQFNKNVEDLNPSDYDKHFKQFVQLSSKKDEDQISIFNPEYILQNIVRKFIDHCDSHENQDMKCDELKPLLVKILQANNKI